MSSLIVTYGVSNGTYQFFLTEGTVTTYFANFDLLVAELEKRLSTDIREAIKRCNKLTDGLNKLLPKED